MYRGIEYYGFLTASFFLLSPPPPIADLEIFPVNFPLVLFRFALRSSPVEAEEFTGDNVPDGGSHARGIKPSGGSALGKIGRQDFLGNCFPTAAPAGFCSLFVDARVQVPPRKRWRVEYFFSRGIFPPSSTGSVRNQPRDRVFNSGRGRT